MAAGGALGVGATAAGGGVAGGGAAGRGVAFGWAGVVSAGRAALACGLTGAAFAVFTLLSVFRGWVVPAGAACVVGAAFVVGVAFTVAGVLARGAAGVAATAGLAAIGFAVTGLAVTGLAVLAASAGLAAALRAGLPLICPGCELEDAAAPFIPVNLSVRCFVHRFITLPQHMLGRRGHGASAQVLLVHVSLFPIGCQCCIPGQTRQQTTRDDTLWPYHWHNITILCVRQRVCVTSWTEKHKKRTSRTGKSTAGAVMAGLGWGKTASACPACPAIPRHPPGVRPCG